MRAYFISLSVGLLVGGIYGLLEVRSPAPPIIALIGLFGMLLGEQAVPLAKRLLLGQPAAALYEAKSVPVALNLKPPPRQSVEDGR